MTLVFRGLLSALVVLSCFASAPAFSQDKGNARQRPPRAAPRATPPPGVNPQHVPQSPIPVAMPTPMPVAGPQPGNHILVMTQVVSPESLIVTHYPVFMPHAACMLVASEEIQRLGRHAAASLHFPGGALVMVAVQNGNVMQIDAGRRVYVSAECRPVQGRASPVPPPGDQVLVMTQVVGHMPESLSMTYYPATMSHAACMVAADDEAQRLGRHITASLNVPASGLARVAVPNGNVMRVSAGRRIYASAECRPARAD